MSTIVRLGEATSVVAFVEPLGLVFLPRGCRRGASWHPSLPVVRSNATMRAALFIAVLAACVPATLDTTDPHGAAGVRIVPTPVARGTAFVTTDGWTVTVEQIALVAVLSTLTPTDDGSGYRSQFVIWDGAHEAETFVSAIPVGPLALNVDPEGLVRDPAYLDPEVPELLAGSSLAPDVRARVLSVPDNVLATRAGYPFFEPLQQGPAVIFAAHAEKDGRTLRIALALASAYQAGVSSSGDLSGAQALDVQANAVRFARYEVHPERIFAASADEAATVFQPIADADRDGDGVVTGAELRATPLPGAQPDDGGLGTFFEPAEAPSCSATSYEAFACVTLLDRIADNAQHVIVAAPPKP